MILTRSSCKMTFIIGRSFAKRQILKKWKWPYLLNWVKFFDKLLHKHWYWQDLAQEIANDIFHWSGLCQAPNSEKVVMALSLELSGILWWNFVYILILTRCTPWDCQMTFQIGWVFAKVQILKKWDYCKMTFILGRGFAECQILKKRKWPYLLLSGIFW